MDTRLSRWCNGLLEAGWLIALLAIPIFFNIHSERVFEPDKLALLRSITLVMSAGWLVRFIDQRGWQDLGRFRFSNPDAVWHRPLVLPVLALVVVYLLATLFSVTPRVSLLGSYQRLQGTYTTLSYIVIFAIMAGTIRSTEQVRRVVTVAIVSTIPVALYGMLQHFGHDPLPWGGNVQARVAGHMGNAIFIAAYLIMVVPLTLGRIVDAFSNILAEEKLAAADVVRSSVYIFILIIQLLTIYWSGSRGPLIGLAVGLFSFTLVLLVSLRQTSEQGLGRRTLPAFLFLLPALLALLISPFVSATAGPLAAFAVFFGVVALSVVAIFVLLVMRRGWQWLWLAWILLTVFMAGWLLLFNIPSTQTASLRSVPVIGGVFQTLNEWRDLPAVGSYGRMLDPTNTTGREKSGRVRVLIWEGVVDLISPHPPLQYPDGRSDPFNWLRPLLGYGPESMYVAYNAFYPPELATVEARNASPDRSHNETFDALVITGLLGLLAWQALYLSVVLFAFRYLGVVRSRRDAWMLAGLWIGGAIIAALVAMLMAGPIYLGVAVPTGVILGVVAYLIYYALFGKPVAGTGQSPDSPINLLAPDRLLMNGLVAAVLAHYVEIHFGIAISATRLYFFAYVALMLALQSAAAAPAAVASPTEAGPIAPAAKTDKRRRRAAAVPVVEPATRSTWSTLLVPGLLMTLMIGILGYNFITYALPPGKVITGPADLSAAEIFTQSFLQNARADFADSPFILSMAVLAWTLGWLVFLSEMFKHGELRWPVFSPVPAQRRQLAAGLLIVLALAGVAARFLGGSPTIAAAMGQSLGLLAATGCGITAALLLLNQPAARTVAGIFAVGLIGFALPVLVTGGIVPGLVMIAGGAALFWLLWDGRWRTSLLPTAAVVIGSLAGGLLYTFLQATRYRSVLFYQGSATAQSAAELRSLEAVQTVSLLVVFYAFLGLILILLSLALSWPGITEGRRPRTNAPAGVVYTVLAVGLAAALWLTFQSNVRAVQADMIYKRARPFDDQATRATQADTAARRDSWDAAIAIYERAIDRARSEDYYYLFLGRALLERAGVTEDATERAGLLTRAERLLLEAQQINPLNTDHTANLARLNTRWYAAATDAAEKQERADLAERYYRGALELSPQNSIIRNEYARLLLEVKGDCPGALAVYDESASIDPYYAQTQLARADAYIVCGTPLPEAERDDYYRTAAAALEQGLAGNPSNVRAWIQLAEIYRQLGDFEPARAAIEQARSHNDPPRIPTAEIDYLDAQITAGLGDHEAARELARRALETASPETAASINSFLAGLDE